jgi:ATP-binding cassette subfamily F protein 3
LDEPTNHLDMQSKDILKNALLQFEGTLIVVSHDRDFLQGLTEKVFEFRNKQIKPYIGDIYDFLESRKLENLKQLEINNRNTDNTKNDVVSDNKINWEKKRESDKEIRKIKNKLDKCEHEISIIEAEIMRLDNVLANPEEHKAEFNRGDIYKTYQELKDKLDEKMLFWEELHTELSENEA